jgi:hypothetical protein
MSPPASVPLQANFKLTVTSDVPASARKVTDGPFLSPRCKTGNLLIISVSFDISITDMDHNRGFKVPFCYALGMTSPEFKTPPMAASDAKLLQDFIHSVITRYTGPAGDLEAALGMYLLGRHLGWRALYIIHSKKTVAKYELILGIEVQDAFAQEGPDAHRSAGLQAVTARSDYWKVVSGEIPVGRDVRNRIE